MKDKLFDIMDELRVMRGKLFIMQQDMKKLMQAFPENKWNLRIIHNILVDAEQAVSAAYLPLYEAYKYQVSKENKS